MPLERRVDAAGLFWDDEHSADQQMEAVAALASHMKFRPRSVITLAPERRAKYLAQLPTVTDTIAARALVNYHLERQRPMMGAFLDLLGIAHENGLISEENLPKPDDAKAKQAAKDLDLAAILGELFLLRDRRVMDVDVERELALAVDDQPPDIEDVLDVEEVRVEEHQRGVAVLGWPEQETT